MKGELTPLTNVELAAVHDDANGSVSLAKSLNRLPAHLNPVHCINQFGKDGVTILHFSTLFPSLANSSMS
jgi:hypothetical protein